MKTVTVPVIKSSENLREALNRVEELMRSEHDDADDELQILTLVIQQYETEHFAFRSPDPIEMIELVLTERNLKAKDLVPCIGSQPRVSEVLGRKRGLTLDMMRKLSQGLGIPIAALIGESGSVSAA
ncbi:MAG TPA: hypothetical protein VG944_13435 [Fimbriimonas sp.]|nr:hypothetical protein [Fimbriimonas sp.]